MNNKPFYFPSNANRNNPYVEFDRGLFIHDQKVKRIAEADWTCVGDNSAPGILRYRVESFSRAPRTAEELAELSLGLEPEQYTAITRSMCSAPIMVEAFAIQQYIAGVTTYAADELNQIERQARRTIHGVERKNGFISLETRIEMQAPPQMPLTTVAATIQYATRVEVDGETKDIIGSFTPDFTNVRPVVDALEDIRRRVQNGDI